jgi:hypothetical protein
LLSPRDLPSALLHRNRQELNRDITENIERFYMLLEFNSEETKKEEDEDVQIGAFRALEEILVDGTFGGEEIFIAYTELYNVNIQIFQPAGNVISYGQK